MIESDAQAKQWLEDLPGVDAEGLSRLEHFTEMLVAENERQNLVARASLPHVWQRHIVDSAQLLRFVPRGTQTWLDLGTGAGFPGIVVAALRPDLKVILVESRTKRIEWLMRACATLGLLNATVQGRRLEAVPSTSFDVISARAFAPLDELLHAAERFSTSATEWLLPKGRSAAQELEALKGWGHAFHVEQSLTDASAGIIVGKLLGRKGTTS